MDLTFQVPMQYCFYSIRLYFHQRHRQLGSLPLWSSCLILSGAINNCPPLFPSSILDTFQPGRLIFSCHTFLPFHTIHGVRFAGILEWFALSSSSAPHFVRTLHYDRLSFVALQVALQSLAHSFTDLHKLLHQEKAMIYQDLCL